MIVYSDNQSLISLFSAIPQNELMHLYTLLGINPDVVSNPTASLTVKQYSAFFRILFNSSFLSQKNSENILSQLEQSSFDDGLRAGVPNEISIAHKFGERLFDGKQQLHDCGIIYYPKHPYLLCVMTRGNDIESLRDAIAKISRFVYKKIDQQY
jgi:beta-lactamase class A